MCQTKDQDQVNYFEAKYLFTNFADTYMLVFLFK